MQRKKNCLLLKLRRFKNNISVLTHFTPEMVLNGLAKFKKSFLKVRLFPNTAIKTVEPILTYMLNNKT